MPAERAFVIIPARMASRRLPGKPLADIAGEPMVVHVLRQAKEAGIGPVAVACCEIEVAEAVQAADGVAILTRPDHLSGSDRVFEALENAFPGEKRDIVINLQGDLPDIDPKMIRQAMIVASIKGTDIATLVAPLKEGEKEDRDVVKALIDPGFAPPAVRTAPILDFRRDIPKRIKACPWHHIGLYAYRREALARYVALPASTRETAERLEQLRALENGMCIAAAFVDTIPVGVDTLDDLVRVRRRFGT